MPFMEARRLLIRIAYDDYMFVLFSMAIYAYFVNVFTTNCSGQNHEKKLGVLLHPAAKA